MTRPRNAKGTSFRRGSFYGSFSSDSALADAKEARQRELEHRKLLGMPESSAALQSHSLRASSSSEDILAMISRAI